MSSSSKHRLMRILLLIVPMTLACGPLDLARDLLARLPTPTPEPSSAEHFVYFVAPDGNDGNTCLDFDQACETVMGAIEKSGPGDSIQVAAGTYLETYNRTNAVYINHDLTIVGDGADSTIIDGQGSRSGIHITVNSTVRIVGVTVQNGGGTSPGNGIAVRNESSLTLIDSVVQSSSNCGLEVGFNTSATLENVDILNNSGAGICSSGTLDITDGSVNNNADSGIASVGDLTVDGTETADNVISGFYIQGGTADLANVDILRNGLGRTHENGLFIRDAVVSIRDSRVTDNEYGVRVFGPTAQLTLVNVTIQGSNGMGLEVEDGSADLTAALVRDNGTLFADTSIAGGITLEDGTLEMRESQVSRNHNGGISNYGGSLIVHSTYVSHNTGRVAGLENNVSSSAEIYDSAFINNGGGPDSAGIENRGTMTIINTTVSGNEPYGIAAIDGQLTLSYTTIAENIGVGLAMFRGADQVRSIENVIVANNSERDCSLSSALGILTPSYAGYNVDTDGSCRFGATVSPADLHLRALVATGGASSSYHPLEIGSPAIDAASGFCPAADQTTVARPFGSACDAGAIEFDPTRSASTISSEGGEAPELAPQGGAEVIDDTLCWKGPGAPYDVVSSLLMGVEVEIIGLGEISGWWIAEHPEFSGIACWVPEDDVSVDPNFDTAQLRLYAVPPLPTPTLPAGCLYQGPNDNNPTCYPIDQCPVSFENSLGACTP